MARSSWSASCCLLVCFLPLLLWGGRLGGRSARRVTWVNRLLDAWIGCWVFAWLGGSVDGWLGSSMAGRVGGWFGGHVDRGLHHHILRNEDEDTNEDCGAACGRQMNSHALPSQMRFLQGPSIPELQFSERRTDCQTAGGTKTPCCTTARLHLLYNRESGR